MPTAYLLAGIALALTGCASSSTTAKAIVRWDFDTLTNLGDPPAGWTDGSQSGSAHTYSVVSFKGQRALHMKGSGETWDRVKVKTQRADFGYGRYTWRVYVPPLHGTGHSTSIGCFLYSHASTGNGNDREIDFEIGYGKQSERERHKIPNGRLMCYMTIQGDHSSGTPHSSEILPAGIQPGRWYRFSISLSPTPDNTYEVRWFVQQEESPEVEGRHPVRARYGPGTAHPTRFPIFCSIENFKNLWIGDGQPREDFEAWFDWVQLEPQASR